ncbi:MAG: hypothetical protein LBU32_32135 [Clostridiales bacterium]|nr:hypothetical protein [Clostridiales bacterium]
MNFLRKFATYIPIAKARGFTAHWVNKDKSIAQTISERTDYIKNPDKTTDNTIAVSAAYIKNPGKTRAVSL